MSSENAGRKRGRQTLRDAKHLLEGILRSLRDAVFILDSDTVEILDCNPAASDIFGYSRGEMLGRTTTFLHVDEAALEEFRRHLYPAIEEKGFLQQFKFRMKRKDGSVFPTEHDVTPLIDERGNRVGWVSVVRDITGRKLMEQALRETEERWHAIYEQSPIGIGIAAPDGKVVSANQAMQTITGYSFEELKHINLADTYENPEDRKRLLNILAQHGSVADYVTRLKRKDGTLYDALLHVAHVYFRGEDVLQTTCIDITEHKQAEEALRKSEERYRSLVEASHAGVAASDLEGKFTFVNNALCQMIGYSKDEMIGSRFIDFIHPDDKSRILQAFQAASTSSRGVIDLEFRVVRKNGEVMHLFASPTPLKDGDNVVGAISIITDITGLKQAQDEIIESEQRFRSLFELAPDAIMTMDMKGTVTSCNSATSALLGFSEDELVGKHFSRLPTCRAADIPRYVKMLTSLVRGNVPLPFEAVFYGKDGSQRFGEVRVGILELSSGKLGIQVVTRDITERKRAEEALRKSEQYFRALFEHAGDSIYVMDMEGKHIVNCNKQASIDLGYSREEILQLSASDIEDILTPEEIIATHHRLKLEESPTIQSRHRRKDDTIFPVEIRFSLLDPARPEFLVAAVRDITKRKKAEEALQESERKYRTLIENIPERIFLKDRNSVYLSCNNSYAQDLKIKSEEIVGKTDYEFYPKEMAEKYRADDRRIVELGETERIEEEYVQDGQERVVETFKTPVKDEKGNVTGVLGIFHDITNRKRAEEQLRQSWNKLRRMLEGTVGALASVAEKRDPYTAGHQERVSGLGCAIAEEMGLPKTQIEGIRVTGTLHDIGKMYVPAEILNKPGPLTDVEMALVRAHSEVGYDIVKGIEFPWPVAQAILQHHERLDGSGYPAGLSGEDIILEARILGVADVVEAMSSPRPFRPALGTDKALEEISRHRGVLYDPRVIDACLKVFTEKGFRLEHKR